jgi:5-methyltetrahydrofolate--homocysteine methyltransferase
MADMNQLAEAVIGGQAPKVKELVEAALNEGASPKEVLDQGLITGMNEVGRRFKANEFYVPEVLIAARAMHSGMDVLEPKLAEAGVEPVAKAAIGTVKGDLHDIGKNLVTMMLKGAGFKVEDLGVDVPIEKFIEAARGDAQVLCLSALLTTTMPQMPKVIEALKEAGVTDVKVMIGGAPVTQKYADEIGADGYAADAASAVDKAKEMIGVG